MTDPRTRMKTVMATVSLVVLGAAAGITGDRMLHRVHGLPAGALSFHDDPLAAIDEAVGLRPDQRPRVHEILRARQEASDRIWRTTHLSLLAVLDSVLADLDVVLDADQRHRMQGLVERLHSPAR